MHLLVDISAHGLGHLAQTAPVIEALQARVPELRMTVRSAVPRLRLEQRIAVGFDHVAEARDCGFVMHNAVDIDLAASATAYREFHHRWRDRIDLEADWLKTKRIDAVLTNVAYLPLAAANRAGLPSASLCSLNWADLFIHYFAGQSWAAKIYDEIVSAYMDADCFLRVSPGLPMTRLRRRRDIGPIARIGQRKRQALSRRFDIAESNRWILLAMGGIGFRLPVESWQRAPGFSWLAPGAWQVQREDVRAFDNGDFDFSDVLASVDAVITKPGYGTLVEAACGGIPILCMQRDDWPESPYFAAWLAAHARSRVVSRGRLMKGDFTEALTQMWYEPVPPVPIAGGAEEAAALLQTALSLR